MELKFKAWDIRNRVMITDAVELIQIQGLIRCRLDLSNPFAYFDGLVWLQFANMKDADGNDLYVGDIVEVLTPDNKFVIRFGKVIRDVLSYNGNTTFKVELNTFYFESVSDGKAYFSITENFFKEHDLSVTKRIGNIYENPELIKITEMPF